MSVTRPARWPARMVGAAAALLPAGQRQRYALEFVAELYGMPRLQQYPHAAQVLLHAWALRSALADQEGDAMTTTTTRKPLRCRFRLHDWDERENPETGERYEICLRCDAYRDHPRAAPGASTAGLAGGMPM